MNAVKKILGFAWILLALAMGYFLISFGGPKFTSGTQDGLVFGIIILFVLLPLIVLGLGVFGYYALMGEYNEED
ncbi:DUF6814 family protein [Moheibacter sediminis]|uniref:Uncharacterized protein n=1 Tax=Moheibacter sediminis TaxID=1434700 RepID=A0A1W2AK36_9FLAO|nr:hypothetical protein [Moheibacter sediminis]SMC60872.1 hypothetical protein SAMN06296427_104227 [Moheibacter sediminis]